MIERIDLASLQAREISELISSEISLSKSPPITSKTRIARWRESRPKRTVRIENRPDFDSLTILQEALKEAEEQLAGNGRLVVRFSGTEPLLRILVEAVTDESAHNWVEKILEAACQEESLGSITVVA